MTKRRCVRPLRASVWCLGAGVLAALAAGRAVEAQVAVISELVHERTAEPGDSYRGSFRIANRSTDSHEVRIYAADYRFHADGTSQYEEPGSLPRSNAGWIRLNSNFLVVAAGAEIEVGYEVTVADDAGPGCFWSLLMVESVPAVSAGEPVAQGARSQVGVETRVRYAVQIATHVREGKRELAIAEPAVVVTEDGTTEFGFNVSNSGEQAVRPQVRVELFDAQGAPVGSFTTVRGLVYPGTSFRQRFVLGALPKGTYTALVLVDAGGGAVFGAQYRLET